MERIKKKNGRPRQSIVSRSISTKDTRAHSFLFCFCFVVISFFLFLVLLLCFHHLPWCFPSKRYQRHCVPKPVSHCGLNFSRPCVMSDVNRTASKNEDKSMGMAIDIDLSYNIQLNGTTVRLLAGVLKRRTCRTFGGPLKFVDKAP